MTAFIDITGKRFGRWTVIGRSGSERGMAMWDCICECGAHGRIYGIHLRRGNSNSCGCRKHDRVKHGQSRYHPAECKAWSGMLRRCENAHDKSYADYGGRGIAVCDRWHDVRLFIADMGPRPSPRHSIDRINNDGDYEPGNCRWATDKEQMNNRRCSRLITFGERTQSVAKWADELGVGWHVLACRLNRGWSVERTLSTPAQRYRGRRN